MEIPSDNRIRHLPRAATNISHQDAKIITLSKYVMNAGGWILKVRFNSVITEEPALTQYFFRNM
jgi:hypothetical protein